MRLAEQHERLLEERVQVLRNVLAAGMRANVENSFTRFFRSSTCTMMVRVQSSRRRCHLDSCA
jgi:hypothetical protein